MKRLLLSTCMAALLAACATPYQIEPSAQTLQQTMRDWAQKEGKSLKWSVEDLQYTEIQGLNHALQHAYSLKDASAILMDHAEKGRQRLSKKPENAHRSVAVCIYSDVVEVRYYKANELACSEAPRISP